MNWLNKLERKFGRYYISNLMGIITAITGAVFIVEYAFRINISDLLYLNPYLVLKGQVWRLVTFIFANTRNSVFTIFMIYFYYIAGNALENVWGGFKFNVYYLVGMLSTILVSFITGIPATGVFVNLSLFLAYAKLYPDMEVLLFFIIPLKIKYLAYFNWAIIILDSLIYIMHGIWGGVLLSVVPIVNYLIFFTKSNYRETKMRTGSVIRMKDYKRKVNSAKKAYTHKCYVCGITDVDDPDMEFRYCSKCTGKKGYCEKHINNHEHK